MQGKSSALKNEREMHNSRHAMPDQWTKLPKKESPKRLS
jgi:hypothetical protein